MPRSALLALVLSTILAGCGGDGEPTAGRFATATVSYVVDGDTIVLDDRSHVRLVQIDAPEREPRECYYRESTRELIRLLPRGTRVALEADPKLDAVDKYGRLLRYVFRGRLNTNLELVRLGAARLYFFFGIKGRYAPKLVALERQARDARRGLWGSCRG